MASNLATRITISANDKATPSIRNVANAAQGLCDKLESMGSRVTGALGLLGIGGTGLALGGMVKNVAMAASRYDMLGAAMEKAGENAGYTAKEMHAAEAQLVRNGIALEKSRETITSLAAANVDLAKSADLARTAQNLAVVANVDSSEAFERLIHGITTAQPEILRTLGLTVNFQQEYAKAAQSMGKTASGLTEQEKLQIRVNAALQAGAGYAGLYEASMTKAGKQLGTFSRHWSNFQTLIGHASLDALSAGVFSVNEALEGLNSRLMAMKDSGELEDISTKVGNGLRAVAENADTAALALGSWAVASRLLRSEGAQRIAALSREHGVMATLKAEFSGTTALLGQDTAAYRANTEAVVANNRARLAAIDKAISSKSSVISELNTPEYATNLDAIRHRKVLEREIKVLQGERVIVTRQLTQATNAMTAATSKGNIALRAMSGLKGAVTGLVNALGGPWVLGITAATAAIYGIATADNHAEREAKKYRISLEGLNAQYDALTRKASEAAGATNVLTAAQARAEQEANNRRVAAAQAEVDSLRDMLARNSVAYETDFFGSVLGEKQYETTKISAYYAEIKKIYQEFERGERTAESAALAFGDVRKALEGLSQGSWFDSTTREAKHLLGTVQLLEGGIGSLIGALSRLGAMKLDISFVPPDSQIAYGEYTANVAKAREETDKLYASTKAGTQAKLEAAVASAKANSELLNDAKSAAVLADAQEKLRKHLAGGKTGGGASAVKAAETAISSLSSKVESLRAQLDQNKGQGFLVGLDKELAGYERSLAKAADATKTKGQELISQAREIGKQIAAEQNLDVQNQFWTQYQQMTGIGLEQVNQAHERALQKQVELYRNAGVEIVDIEAWAAAQRLEHATDFTSGAIRGLRNYGTEASNMAKNAEQAFTGAFGGIANSLSFSTQGMKFSVTSLVDSIINDFARLMFIKPFTGAVASLGSSLLGNLFGSSSGFLGGAVNTGLDILKGFGLHSGGRVGADSSFVRPVPAWLVAEAPRLHTGGPILGADERLIIAQTGEEMLSRREAAAYRLGLGGQSGASGGPVNLSVVLKNESGQPLQAKSQQTQWSGDMRSAVVTIVLDAFNRNYMGMRDTLGS